MSNLSKRVEKAKKLVYSNSSPYRPGQWGTWGSSNGEYYYHVKLAHQKETITTPDGKKNISVFIVSCKKDTGNGVPCNCPGNERHTVCYHSLGAIYRSFEQAEIKRLVSFFESYEAASRMAFGGKVAKIKSANGPGIVWCVVKDWPKLQKAATYKSRAEIQKENERILSAQENINLMRGSENDEGID